LLASRIGRFEIRQRLGEGSFGVVYRAYDPQLDREVALKVAKPEQVNSEARIKRFLREARAAANLRHPHIVPVYDSGNDAGRYYIASALISGQSLADALPDTPGARGLDMRRSARIIRQLAEALAYAHGKGVIHRDVKPANVLLDEGGDALLADFGLAARPEGEEKLTQEGAGLGTPAYMAPEQMAGEAVAASDQYSLGCSLHELLTGQTPFSGPPELQMLLHQTQQPPSPRKQNRHVPRDLETICLKCLEKEPARRYADCQALAEDLRRFLAGELVRARRVSRWEQTWRWARRNPGVAMLSGATALSLLVAAALGLVFAVIKTRDNASLSQANKDLDDRNLKLGLALEGERQAKLGESTKSIEARFQGSFALLREGIGQCERTDKPTFGLGILTLARGLEMAPDDEPGRPQLKFALQSNLAHWSQTMCQMQMCFDHKGPVNCVAFSPDGTTLLTASEDGTAALWDPVTGQHRLPPLRHKYRVTSAMFVAEGRLVATFGDAMLQMWDAATGKPRGEPLMLLPMSQTGPPEIVMIRAVAIAPDGKSVLVGYSDGSARFWDVGTRRLSGTVVKHGDKPITALAFSRDGKQFLTAGVDAPLCLWETSSGKEVKRLGDGRPAEGVSISTVTFSDDGREAFGGDSYGMVRAWSLTSPDARGAYGAHGGAANRGVQAVALAPDRKTGLSVTEAGTACLWGFRRGLGEDAPVTYIALEAPVIYQSSPLTAAAIHPGGQVFAIGGKDGMVRLWRRPGSALRKSIKVDGAILIADISRDGKLLATGTNFARLWDLENGKSVGKPLPYNSNTRIVVFSPDGGKVVSNAAGPPGKEPGLSGDMNVLQQYGVSQGDPVAEPLRHPGRVYSAAYSPDGKLILTGCGDKHARMWDAATGRPIGEPLAHEGFVFKAVFSVDGKIFVTYSHKSIYFWETRTRQPLGPVLASDQHLRDFSLAPDGRHVLTVSEDRVVRLWIVEGRKLKFQTPPLPGGIVTARFNHSGRMIATTCDTGVQLWDAQTGKPVHSLEVPIGRVNDLSFSLDDRLLLVSNGEYGARLWELSTGKPVGPSQLMSPTLPIIWRVVFLPDSKSFLTTGSGQAAVWELETPLIGKFEHTKLWLETVTGTRWDEGGAPIWLNAAQWRARKNGLDKAGGSPPR